MSKTMSKGEFATLCKVDASRVSHWVADGKISGDALVGSGRSARIVPEIAQRQLRDRLDFDRRMAGGAKAKLDAPKAPAPSSLPSGVWQLIHDLPSLAAWHVAACGVPIEVAFLAYHDMHRDLTEAATRFFGPLPADFEAPDFQAIAEEYGLAFDPARCEAALARRNNSD